MDAIDGASMIGQDVLLLQGATLLEVPDHNLAVCGSRANKMTHICRHVVINVVALMRSFTFLGSHW